MDLVIWGALSDEKWGLQLSVINFFLLDIASAAFLSSESHRTYKHILLSLFLRLPNLEDQVPVFISPGRR
jgi:hypothetical protein